MNAAHSRLASLARSESVITRIICKGAFTTAQRTVHFRGCCRYAGAPFTAAAFTGTARRRKQLKYLYLLRGRYVPFPTLGEGWSMDDLIGIKDVMLFKRTINQREYLVLGVISWVAWIVVLTVGGEIGAPAAYFVLGLGLPATVYFAMAVAAARARGIGRSGWIAISILIPPIGVPVMALLALSSFEHSKYVPPYHGDFL